MPMLSAFFLSLGQLLEPRIVRVFLKSMLLTIVIFCAIGAGIWWVSDWGMRHFAGWQVEGLASFVAVVTTLLAAWLLFRAVAIAAIGVFADEVVHAVEARHYPEALTVARDVPLPMAVAMGLGSAGRFLLYNLFVSPLYLILIVTGVGPAILFFVLNGWLLGRDLGDMVAARHMPMSAMGAWRRTSRGWRFVLGLAGAGAIVVPGINLIVPVMGAAMATHLFHRGRRA
ncbi:EI24 domain-containing protein [soil metagenome]